MMDVAERHPPLAEFETVALRHEALDQIGQGEREGGVDGPVGAVDDGRVGYCCVD